MTTIWSPLVWSNASQRGCKGIKHILLKITECLQWVAIAFCIWEVNFSLKVPGTQLLRLNRSSSCWSNWCCAMPWRSSPCSGSGPYLQQVVYSKAVGFRIGLWNHPRALKKQCIRLERRFHWHIKLSVNYCSQNLWGGIPKKCTFFIFLLFLFSLFAAVGALCAPLLGPPKNSPVRGEGAKVSE